MLETSLTQSITYSPITMKKTDFQPYDPSELDILLKEPWEVSDRPFMLHAAYALSCLYDLCAEEDDEEDFAPDNIWGSHIPQKILDRLVEDVKADFNDASSNRKAVRIWNKTYSIRKVNAYDHNRLHLIFNFPLEDGEYIITKEGVLNLGGPTMKGLEKYQVSKEQSQVNRTYLRQIIKLAEDDEHNGWDKLTDMEIVVYCWALYYNKYQHDNFVHFKKDYNGYLYVTDKAIFSCLNEKGVLMERPTGMYAFSHDKVMEWNEANSQKSYANLIPTDEADDYWYDVALKKTFKPIDHK